mmetsp:Transcript_67370/g.145284  ORF Transcript_67370/g.145284 Transcript_67370/m.145284 type:complete len:93 (+) Transcript_67370:106-384(+)
MLDEFHTWLQSPCNANFATACGLTLVIFLILWKLGIVQTLMSDQECLMFEFVASKAEKDAMAFEEARAKRRSRKPQEENEEEDEDWGGEKED